MHRRRLFIYVDERQTAGEQPISIYLMPMRHPLVVSEGECHATLLQANIASIDTYAKRNEPCRLHIRQLGVHNEEHSLYHHIEHKPDSSFVCLLPSASASDLHSDVTMMPPTPGLYHCLEICVRSNDSGDIIPLRRLQLIIQLEF